MPKWSDGGSHIGGTLTKKSDCHNGQPHLQAEVASFSNQSGLSYHPKEQVLTTIEHQLVVSRAHYPFHQPIY